MHYFQGEDIQNENCYMENHYLEVLMYVQLYGTANCIISICFDILLC